MPFQVLEEQLIKRPELDAQKIKQAYDLAEQVHEGQKRLSGEAYINHPVAVGLIILKAGGDQDMICAALLHDAIEDADDPVATAEAIEKQFGFHVYFLVDAVSKNFSIKDSHLRHQDFIEQLDAAFKIDVGVFFIKWADLLHNLESIELLKPEKKAKWLNELEQDYLPTLSDYFHRLSFRYHPMYHNLMDQFETMVSTKI